MSQVQLQHIKSPSLKYNTLANYVGQIASIIIGIVFVPFYLNYLGAEAYGLVGFFVVMQTWFGVLDIGLSPILNREVAKARAKSHEFMPFRRLLRSVELIFLGVSALLALAVWALSETFAMHWFKLQVLSVKEVAWCVVLMGLMGGMRLYSAIYRSGFSGMEAQVPLNGINIAFSLVKALGSLAILRWVSTDPLVFFIFQFVVGVLEPLMLGGFFYRLLPPATERVGLRFYWQDLKPTLPFGLSVALNSVIIIALTQFDKFLLSGILPLDEYGYMSLVATLTMAVIMMAGPLSNALTPRLTYLHSRQQEDDMYDLYRKASQVSIALMVSICGVVALFGNKLLWAWTGNMQAADWGAPVLFWYMLGVAFHCMVAYPFMLQYANGQMRYNTQMNLIRSVLYLPLVAWVAYHYGAVGAAMSWFVMQFLSFVIWAPIVHNKFKNGFNKVWMKDVLPVVGMAFVGMLILACVPAFLLEKLNRLELFIVLMMFGGFELAMACAGSAFVRTEVRALIRKVLKKA